MKFYKNKNEAIKVILPASVLILVAGAITMIWMFLDLFSGRYFENANVLLSGRYGGNELDTQAAVIVFVLLKVCCIIAEVVVARKSLGFYLENRNVFKGDSADKSSIRRNKTEKVKAKKVGRRKTENIKMGKFSVPRFRNAAITLTVILAVLAVPYVALITMGRDTSYAWLGFLQSFIGLLSLILLVPAVYTVTKNERRRKIRR